jgi:hypothetical protein
MSDKDGSEEPSAVPALMPAAEKQYLQALVAAIRKRLDLRLAGLYLFGSAAYGDYQLGASDLDVQAVTTDLLEPYQCVALAQAISHAQLPCPARQLEFVCYPLSAVTPAARHPRFQINLNTGAGRLDHVGLNPAEEASHWFVLDIAIGRELGWTLLGPAPTALFAEIPRRWALAAIADSIEWHEVHEAVSRNSILNACRGWRYAQTSLWGSKSAGYEWASKQPGCELLLAAALQEPPSADAIKELFDMVRASVRRQLQLA